MRTTLDLDDELMRQADECVLERGVTLTELVEQGLRREIQERARQGRNVTFPTGPGETNLPAGIDINDTSAVLDYLGYLAHLDELESRHDATS